MAVNAEQISEWIIAAQQGDDQALNRLLEHYRPRVWRYLRARLRSEEDCNDLTQQVLIRVARALPHTVLKAPFEHWLFQIAANSLCTFYRQRSQRLEIPFSDLPDPEWAAKLQQESPEASLIEQVAHQQVQQRLKEIIAQVCSAEERWVILLCEQGEGLEAIARMLHRNRNTVRTHLMRGRAKVLAYIVQHEPKLVGGVEAIECAIEQLRREGGPREQLTAQEVNALRQPGHNQPLLRKACLKIARFLQF